MGTVLLIDPARGADLNDPSVTYAQYAQRAYPKAQQLLEGVDARRIFRPLQVTWHDLGLSDYAGAFVFVNQDAPDLAGMIGAVLRLTVGGRSTLVMVLGSDAINADISLARRAFLALAPLSADPLTASGVVIHEP